MAEETVTIQQLSATVFIVKRQQAGVAGYVWQDGRLVATTTKREVQVQLSPGEKVKIQVFDSASDRPADGFPGRAFLEWYDPALYGSPIAAAHYEVEEYVGSAWVLRQRIQDDGRGYYYWESRYLEDCTTHQFRVTAIAASGAESPVLEHAVLMVRYPDPPGATYTLDEETGVITVS